eukprot:COSAG02_NODE_3806_length_6203_cov_175.828637_5_plen_184_part_00
MYSCSEGCSNLGLHGGCRTIRIEPCGNGSGKYHLDVEIRRVRCIQTNTACIDSFSKLWNGKLILKVSYFNAPHIPPIRIHQRRIKNSGVVWHNLQRLLSMIGNKNPTRDGAGAWRDQVRRRRKGRACTMGGLDATFKLIAMGSVCPDALASWVLAGWGGCAWEGQGKGAGKARLSFVELGSLA